MKKKSLLLVLVLPLLITGCQTKDNPSSSSEPFVPYSVDLTSYSVTLSTGAGYEINGAKSVYKDTNYIFSVSVKNGYSGEEMVVKANGQVVTKANNLYTVYNVQGDISITVEGVFENSVINLTTTTYPLNINSITQAMKETSYYMNGVSGKYRGVDNQVQVDISQINFTKEGTYDVIYSLVGHEEVVRNAVAVVYETPSIDNVTIDLSNYKTNIINADIGELFVDYYILNANKEPLTNSEICYEGANNIVYFTKDYLSNLSLISDNNFYLSYLGEEIPFKVSVTDKNKPVVKFSNVSGDYGYLLTDKIVLPTAEIDSSSLQHLEFKYSLDDKEVNPSEVSFNAVGQYVYKIEVFRGNEKFTDLTRTYNINILSDYNIHEDTDINGSFFFYNTSILSRFISKANILSVNSAEKKALISGDSFYVTNEVITIARQRGYKYMKLNITNGVSDAGEYLSGVPYVSRGGTEINEEGKDVFWKKYYSENAASKGNVSIVVDIGQIDLEKYPETYFEFDFRTPNCQGSNQSSSAYLSVFEFYVDKPNKDNLVEFYCGSGEYLKTEETENSITVSVSNMSYNYQHFGYAQADKFYKKGYRNVTITATGQNHMLVAYNNSTASIPKVAGTSNLDYSHTIAQFDGSVTLPLKEGCGFVNVMTCHGLTALNVNDDSGIYPEVENFTITFTFSK